MWVNILIYTALQVTDHEFIMLFNGNVKLIFISMSPCFFFISTPEMFGHLGLMD